MAVRAAILVALVLAGCSQPAPTMPDPVPAPNTGAAFTSDDVVANGEHLIPVTIHQPRAASVDAPVPVLLHSHGFAGSRHATIDAFRPFLAAGFGVISFDMRGHGDAKDASTIHMLSPDHEISDVRAVISYAASLDWVLLDGVGDPRIGAMGRSYGGAYQLLTAAADDRLDALVPEITWHDLPRALAPNGFLKRAWLDLLYTGALTGGNLDGPLADGFATALATGTIPPAFDEILAAASPSNYALGTPTLLIQGNQDSLFGLDEARANMRQLQAAGADVALATHFGGHVLVEDGLSGVGLNRPSEIGPCGDPTDLAIAWFAHHLLGAADETVDVCIALDGETTFSGTAWPETSIETVALGDVASPGRYPLPAGTIVGNAMVTGHGFGDLLWRLEATSEAGSRILGDQVTPTRIDGSFSIQLAAVAEKLAAGEQLHLVLGAPSSQFDIQPDELTIRGLQVELPFLDAGKQR